MTLLLMCIIPLIDAVRGGVRSNYHLKGRSLQDVTTIITLDEIQKYLLTFNDDSAPKAMSPFLIDLFETDGNLPTESLSTVATALETFLRAELNAVYAPIHSVENVIASFPSQDALSTGSELLTYVNITFDHEPSPEKNEVEVWLQTIMSDMSYFVQNISAIGSSDPELQNITSADHKPYYENGDRGQVIPGISKNPTGKEPPLYSILPTVFAAAMVVLLIGFFVLRRRRSVGDARTAEEQRSLATKVQTTRNGDDFLEDDSDIFSFEVSLIESPAVGTSASTTGEAVEVRAVPRLTEESPTVKTVEVHEIESDLFSGIHSNVTGVSPRNIEESRSIFSFLSGFTGASASTVRHSNVTKEDASAAAVSTTTSALDLTALSGTHKAGNGETPRSRVSSLFAFSEEEEEDISGSSEDEKSKSPIQAPFDEGGNDKSNTEANALSTSSSGEFGPQTPVEAADSSFLLKGSLAALSGAAGAIVARSSDYSYLLNKESSTTTKSAANDLVKKEAIAVVAPARTLSVSTSSKPATMGISFDSYNTEAVSLLAESHPASSPASSSEEVANETSEDQLQEGPSEEYSEAPEEPEKIFEKSGRKWGLTSSAMAALGNLALKARGNRSTLSSTPKEAPTEEEDGYLAANPSEVNLRWDSPNESAKNAAIAAAFVGAVNQAASSAAHSDAGSATTDQSASGGGRRGRRHAKSTAADGTEAYQSEAMRPVDWSIRSGQSGSNTSGISPRSEIDVVDARAAKRLSKGKKKDADTPKSQVTNDSTVSALSISTGMNDTSTSDSLPFDATPTSPSKKLISDLVWLEKKIAGATKSVKSSAATTPPQLPNKVEREVAPPPPPPPSQIRASDSISFSSNDANDVAQSPSNDSSSLELNSYGEGGRHVPGGLHSIVCKDCFAPPGKLKIVIHSTKDGPAVHTVKKGSSLEGHLYRGDLIISVDGVDTRSYTAEQVMKMMTARTKYERKITVLHFEHSSGGDGGVGNADASADATA